MSFHSTHYNPQVDWWSQPASALPDSSGTGYCTAVNVNAFQYPMQQQSHGGHRASYVPTHANEISQNNQVFPNYWLSDLPSFVDPNAACQQPSSQPTHRTPSGQYAPSASLPPAVFTKYPLPIDNFLTNSTPAYQAVQPISFYTGDQVLPVSDVPALDYDSTSADETVYAQSNWIDSPIPKVEEESTSSNSAGETSESPENADPCYAELLRQALMGADGYTMLLKDLYEWVRTHSSKAQDPNNRGWQNSVRHNLSMNAAFERVPPTNQEAGTKKTSFWRLTQQAVEHGISSTTRYRKDSKRKTARNPNPAPLRVQSGAKGGQATRRSVRRQQKAASPPDGISPSSGISRQRNFRGPCHSRRTRTGQLNISPSEQQQLMLQRSFPAPGSSPFFENTADMFDALPNPYPLDNKFEENHEFLAPFNTTRPLLDWSLSPSPLSHAGNDIGWLSNQQNLGI